MQRINTAGILEKLAASFPIVTVAPLGARPQGSSNLPQVPGAIRRFVKMRLALLVRQNWTRLPDLLRNEAGKAWRNA